jgi:hypothetical protein
MPTRCLRQVALTISTAAACMTAQFQAIIELESAVLAWRNHVVVAGKPHIRNAGEISYFPSCLGTARMYILGQLAKCAWALESVPSWDEL